MKRIVLAAAVLLAGAGVATAADMPIRYPVKAPLAPAPTFSWTGVYIGANGGGGFFQNTTTDYTGALNFGIGGDFSKSAVGAFGGGTLGANMQFGQLVVGLEADFQWSGLEANRTFNAGANVNNASWDWFGTVRARAGLAFDRSLVYVTGGAAFVSAKYTYGRIVSPGAETVVSDDTQWGFAAGGGIEYAFTDHWTAKAEYIYIGLPSRSATDSFLDDYDFRSSAHLARVGVNYKF